MPLLNELISLFRRSADEKNGFTLIENRRHVSHFVISLAGTTPRLYGSRQKGKHWQKIEQPALYLLKFRDGGN